MLVAAACYVSGRSSYTPDVADETLMMAIWYWSFTAAATVEVVLALAAALGSACRARDPLCALELWSRRHERLHSLAM